MGCWSGRFTAFWLACAAVPVSAQGPVAPQARTISVSGSAELKVKPDQILVSLGIETRDPDLGKAKSDNELWMQKVLAFLDRSGVARKDAQLDFLALAPEYRNTSPVPTLYTAARNFTVLLHTDGSIENVLSGCIQYGVNHVYGVDFRTSGLKKYREQARELAIKAAREKAEKLTAALNLNVGDVLTISESSGGGSTYWYPGFNRQRGMGASQVSVQDGNDRGGADPTMAIGEIPVSATVHMTFLIQ